MIQQSDILTFYGEPCLVNVAEEGFADDDGRQRTLFELVVPVPEVMQERWRQQARTNQARLIQWMQEEGVEISDYAADVSLDKIDEQDFSVMPVDGFDLCWN